MARLIGSVDNGKRPPYYWEGGRKGEAPREVLSERHGLFLAGAAPLAGDEMRSAVRASRRGLYGIILLIFVTLLPPPALPTDSDRPLGRPNTVSGPIPTTSLGSMLARAAEYCDKLDRSVLNFVCRERIEEWLRHDFRRMGLIFVGARERHEYLYDYQLVRDREGLFEESRVLLKEDGKEVRVPGSPLKTRSFTHAKVVMGPLGLLRRETQAEHDYRIVREEKVRGEEALVIEAVPKPGPVPQQLFGTIWLRKKDAGILKIEWNPASIGHYQIVEETARRLDMTPDLLIISEYAFEKNGVRFPSRYTVKEAYRRSIRRLQVSEVDVVYDEYKFFTVETAVDIRGGGHRP